MDFPAMKFAWANKWRTLWEQGKYTELVEQIESNAEFVKANGSVPDFLAAQNDNYVAVLKCSEIEPFEKYARKLFTYKVFLESVAGMAAALPYHAHAPEVVLPIAHNLLWVAYMASFQKTEKPAIQQMIPTVAACMRHVAICKGMTNYPSVDYTALEKYIITVGVQVVLRLNDSDCIGMSHLLVTLGMILSEKAMQSPEPGNNRLVETFLLLQELYRVIEEESFEVNHYKRNPATFVPLFMFNTVNESSTYFEEWSKPSRGEFKDFLIVAQAVFASVLCFEDSGKGDEAIELCSTVAGPKYKCLAIYLAALNLHKVGKYEDSLQTILTFRQHENNAHPLLHFRAYILIGVNYIKLSQPLQACIYFRDAVHLASHSTRLGSLCVAYIASINRSSPEPKGFELAIMALKESEPVKEEPNFMHAVISRILHPYVEVNPVELSYAWGRQLLEEKKFKEANEHYHRVFHMLKNGEQCTPFYHKFVAPPFTLPPFPFIYHEAIYCCYFAKDLTVARQLAEEASQRYVPNEKKFFHTMDDVLLSLKKDVITLWLLSLVNENSDFAFDCITNALSSFCHLKFDVLPLVAKVKARLLWRRALWQESRGLKKDAALTYSQALESYPDDILIFRSYMRFLSNFKGFARPFVCPPADVKEVYVTESFVLQNLLKN